MTAAHVDAVVADLLSRVLERTVSPTRDTMLWLDLGVDSVRVLELVAAIEDHFDITVPLDHVARIRTFGEMVDHIQAALDARAS